ncbi:MAG: peptidoglycan D,D-transpeptidase FtsI family protein [Acidimicrobiales bacterium]
MSKPAPANPARVRKPAPARGRKRPPARVRKPARAAPARAAPARAAPARVPKAPGRRLLGLLVLIGLVFAAVTVRLADVQVVGTQRYTAYGKAEVLHSVSLPALRGTIYDSSGLVLAMSEPETTVIADDFQITDPGGEAAKLAPILHMTAAQLDSALSQASGFVKVAEQVGPAASAKVKALDLPGLTFQSASQRFLPSGNLALPVIGQVNSNGLGYSGVEEQYNKVLTGHTGSEVLPLDPNGRTIPGGPQDVKPALPGEGLVLTINHAIQFDAENALSAEIVKSQAKSGWVVVLDTKGDIVAMANMDAGPTPGSAPVPATSALALTNVYEPGSVAKLATFAGTLSQGLISPSSVFTIPPQMTLGGAVFSDAEVHGTEQLSATQILAQSSNLGTIQIAQLLGPQGLYHWLRAMGWGASTGLGFPGASAGILPAPSSWSGSTMGSMPIGQAEAVSALQVADAYNMVANGGVFVPPRLVEATVGADGTRHDVAPLPSHRVLSPTVARQLMTMLGDVVKSGTAPEAAVPGYTVVGKTGTAQVPSNGAYVPGAFMASFVGIVPAQHPALTMVVTLDQPGSTNYYGGSVAAPVFSQIATDALRLLHVPPGGVSGGSVQPGSTSTTIGGSASAAPG